MLVKKGVLGTNMVKETTQTKYIIFLKLHN